MFGFGRKKKSHPQEGNPGTSAESGGGTHDASQEEAGAPPAHVVANATQMVAAATGLTTYNIGERLWLHAPAIGLNELECGNVDLRINIVSSDQGVPIHHVFIDWHGVLDAAQFATAQGFAHAWNNEYAAPRVQCYQDERGEVRFRGEIIMPWRDGYSVAQLSSFLHSAVEMAMLLSDNLAAHWPEAPIDCPHPSDYPESGMMMPGNQQSMEAAEQFLAPVAVPAFGFQVGQTPPITVQRIADAAASVIDHPVEVTSEGIVEIDYGPFRASIELTPAILSIRTYIGVQTSDVDAAAEELTELACRHSQDPLGSVVTVHKSSAGELQIICARHVFTNGGRTDRDLAWTLAEQCDVVLQCFGRVLQDLDGN